MTASGAARALRWACVASLLSIGLMVWSLFDPRPLPVVIAMSVGQGVGTLSLLTFLVVVFADLRRTALRPEVIVHPAEGQGSTENVTSRE